MAQGAYQRWKERRAAEKAAEAEQKSDIDTEFTARVRCPLCGKFVMVVFWGVHGDIVHSGEAFPQLPEELVRTLTM